MLEVPNALEPVFDCFPGGYDAPDSPTGLAQILAPSYALPSHVNATSIRLDHVFSPKLSGFVRYGDTPSYSQTRQLYSLTVNRVDTQTFTLGATDQTSATSSNEFRLGYSRNSSSVDTRTQSFFDAYPPLNLNTAIGIPASYSPVSSEAYIHIVGVGDSASNTDQASGSLHQWNLRDTFSFQTGNHLLKFGYRPAAYRVDTQSPRAVGRG